MKMRMLISISREWKVSKGCRRSGEQLALEVGQYVFKVLEEHPELFPTPIEYTASYFALRYTPSVLSEPWEWWSKVIFDVDFGAYSSDLTNLLQNLMPLLPENTHVQSLPLVE